MDASKVMQIFKDTAYVRTGGSPEELRAANYIKEQCAALGLDAQIVPFDVEMATIKNAKIYADGVEIPCKGYLCAGCADLEAPLYYLRSTAVLFAMGILGATPVVKNMARRIIVTKAGPILELLVMVALMLICTGYLVDGSFSPFLYFRF